MSVVALVVTGALLWLGYLHRSAHHLAEHPRRIGGPQVQAAAVGGAADVPVHRDHHLRAVRLHLGRQPAHRQGPRPRAAGQPGALLHPGRAVPAVRRGLRWRSCCPTRSRARPRCEITRTWYAPGRRVPDGRLRPVRADRLPARRRLAPHLRSGRHAVGADPPDDDRRRRLLDDRRAAPRVRGRAGDGRPTPDGRPRFLKFVQYLGFGGIVIGLSVFQIEFDFGVPQFRQVFAADADRGAGAFAARRGAHDARAAAPRSSPRCSRSRCAALVALVVGPVLGAPINWFALYLGAAVVVELLALTPLFKRPIVFGARQRPRRRHRRAVAGVVLDRRRLSLPVAVEHLARGAGDGRAGRGRSPAPAARCSAWCSPASGCPARAISIGLVVLTVLAIGGATANGLRYEVPQNATATITLTEVPSDRGQAHGRPPTSGSTRPT